MHFVLCARSCLRLFLLVLGCPIGLSFFQADAIVVIGCRLQKSCLGFGCSLLFPLFSGDVRLF